MRCASASRGWSGPASGSGSGFDVDPVALHIHERVSAQAILKLALREPTQRSLFADPELDYRDAVHFYQHDVDWANRLILGDSLTVMASLARREDLAGKVQMIYMDPPYGIKFASQLPVAGGPARREGQGGGPDARAGAGARRTATPGRWACIRTWPTCATG